MTFKRAVYDSEAVQMYLRVVADISGAQVVPSLEGHTLHLGEDGRVVGLTLLGLRGRCERGEAATVTVHRPVGDQRFTLNPGGLLAVATSGPRRAAAVHRAARPSATSPAERGRGKECPCS